MLCCLITSFIPISSNDRIFSESDKAKRHWPEGYPKIDKYLRTLNIYIRGSPEPPSRSQTRIAAGTQPGIGAFDGPQEEADAERKVTAFSVLYWCITGISSGT